MAKRPAVPSTRNWKAIEFPNLIGRRYWLMVAGEVLVTSTNQVPKLSAHVPQGINPRILLLDLKIVRTGGIGLPVLLYKQALFQRRTSGNQYDEVDILYRGRIIKRIKVAHPKSVASVAKKRRKKTKKKKAKRKAVRKKKRL